MYYTNKNGTPSDVGEPTEDKDNGHISSAVTGCLQFGEDATSMTRRLGAEAPKKKLVYQKKKNKNGTNKYSYDITLITTYLLYNSNNFS
jgi:hypothetical protein